MTWIDDQFPGAVGLHEIKSEPTEDYNCIGWAATASDSEWWTFLPGYKWPATRSPLVESLVAVFESLGYSRCETGDHQPNVEKIAVYARGTVWTHAARQLPNGKWTSKLGDGEDVEHDTADCLCGRMYGRIHCYMKRPKA